MVVRAGSHVGAYEIVALLGTGGMGEVYRAHDGTLGREVALKILPEEWLTDPDRRARLDREARVLAALNHPHIGAIYGIEDAAIDGGRHIRALVLELVEGETLADRIAEGSGLRAQSSGRYQSSTTRPSASSARPNKGLEVAEALKIAQQIADALDAAHEKGIIHRDLKPANIKITPDGTVKVLDFGLATFSSGAAGAWTQGSTSLATQAPVVPLEGTREGVILGTAGYMSPEQARGRAVDKRTDIWAFGCVLFEMLTGRAPFARDTPSDSLAAVLDREPDWSALPAATPVSVRRLLERCLAKDPKRRLRDVGDAGLEMEESLSSPAPLRSDRSRRSTASEWMKWIAALGATAAVTGLVVWSTKSRQAPSASTVGAITQFVIATAPTDPLALDNTAIAMSADGRSVAYVAGRGNRKRIYLREVDKFTSTPIAGTDGGFYPFFSPDGQWVGFFADRKMKKVLRSGGTPQTIAEPTGANNITASWDTQDTILFTPIVGSGIWRTSSAGGSSTVLTTLMENESSHAWPQLLPDGRTLLFSAVVPSGDPQVYVQPLDTGERRPLVRGFAARYLPSGHLIYAQGGTVLAVPFDATRRELTGTPVAVRSDVMQVARLRNSAATSLVPQITFSHSGAMAYVPGNSQRSKTALVWVDRAGLEQSTVASGATYFQPRLSPDNQRLAVTIGGSDHDDVWLHDLARGTWSRFTSEANSGFPAWTSDGQRLTYASDRAGSFNMYSRPLDGSAKEERLSPSSRVNFPFSWSPDGFLAFVAVQGRAVQSIHVLHKDRRNEATPFVETGFGEGAPAFSPDGHRIAYVSAESGRNEIYVRRFPGGAESVTISTEGGNEPVWSRNGKELFYRTGDDLMAVDIATGPAFSAGKPRLLFKKSYEQSLALWPAYDVSSDGQRFVMVKRLDQDDPPAQINVVTNWFDELKRVVAQTRKP
jgi:serine/threonine protein kinase